MYSVKELKDGGLRGRVGVLKVNSTLKKEQSF